MYITDHYWNNYIGDTDDSLNLGMYLADKNKEEITLAEIFSDLGLNKLDGDFRQHDDPLTVPLLNISSDYDEVYIEFYYAIDIITDLAALLLECKINGSIPLPELFGEDLVTDAPNIRITATEEESGLISKALADFAAAPFSYDISEMEDEDSLHEIAKLCAELRNELYAQ